jgi:hypothetical protein
MMTAARFFQCLVLLALLFPHPARSTTWHVPDDIPSIQEAIHAAAAGDDVLIAPGTYSEYDIVMKDGVLVHSEQGASVTTVNPARRGRGFSCVNLQGGTTIEGLTILNGGGAPWAGGGVYSENSRVVIRDCIFRACSSEGYGGAIYSEGSNTEIRGCTMTGCDTSVGGGVSSWFDIAVSISDCRITGNEGFNAAGGILAFAQSVTIERCFVSENYTGWGSGAGITCGNGELAIRDCVVTDNFDTVMGGGTGFYVTYATGTISGCTLAGNDTWYHDTGVILIEDSQIELERVIVAFNWGAALQCGWESEVYLTCCDFYDNVSDQICGDDWLGNFSQDPLFCDRQNDDYTLDAASPCLPGNHPEGAECGLIGASGLGCGAPPATGACCLLNGTCVVQEAAACDAQQGTYQGDGTTCDPDPCQPTAVRPSTWGRIKASYR